MGSMEGEAEESGVGTITVILQKPVLANAKAGFAIDYGRPLALSRQIRLARPVRSSTARSSWDNSSQPSWSQPMCSAIEVSRYSQVFRHSFENLSEYPSEIKLTAPQWS
jgi:hypothetical protein